MHILQPKPVKLNEQETQELLENLNISKSQLPKILSSDSGLPQDCQIGDVIKFIRDKGGTTNFYYRVVV